MRAAALLGALLALAAARPARADDLPRDPWDHSGNGEYDAGAKAGTIGEGDQQLHRKAASYSPQPPAAPHSVEEPSRGPSGSGARQAAGGATSGRAASGSGARRTGRSSGAEVRPPEWLLDEYERRQANGFETPSRVPNRAASANDVMGKTVSAVGQAAGLDPDRPVQLLAADAAAPNAPAQWNAAGVAAGSGGRGFVPPWLVRAREKLARGDFAGAARDARETRDDPNPAAYKILARALYKQNDLEGARRAALEALRLNPQDAEAYRLLAAVLEAQGDHAGAVRALEEAARLDPRYRRLYEAARGGARVEYPELGDLGLAEELARTSSRLARLKGLVWFLAGAATVAALRQRRRSA